MHDHPIPLLIVLACALRCAAVDAVAIPNPSFESGTGDRPEGWTLDGGGRWLEGDAADGRHAIAVTGNGSGSSQWRSAPLALRPGALYQLTFKARGLGAGGGTPISGTSFCNRDLGSLPDTWTPFTSIIATPDDLKPDAARLRFGQWEVNGTVAFDASALAPVQALHRRVSGIELGEGECIAGTRYRFDAPWHAGVGHSRPLVGFQAHFNSNRWILNQGSSIIHRHGLQARMLAEVRVTVGVVWHQQGSVAIEVSPDGSSWQAIGSLDRTGTITCAVPAAHPPAAIWWTRLRAVGAASLQIGSYAVDATLPGNAIDATGGTSYIAITGEDERLGMIVESIGDGIPGGDNAVRLRLANRSARPLALTPRVAVAGPGGAPRTATMTATVDPGATQVVAIPYDMPDAGLNILTITLGDGLATGARISLPVSHLHACSYGARLPASSDRVGLWWAPSGWKVSRQRPPPLAQEAALVIRAARNEAEAAQFVLRPVQALTGLTASPGTLTAPGGAAIAADAIEILRIGYVEVTRPTDGDGCAAPWPDPLPPLRGPLDCAAGRNQPFWVRVTVPRDAVPGTYTGAIALKAGDWSATVPMQVEVFAFTLPDRMSCATAFGFSPSRVWQYQRVPQDQRRAVLEKYWDNFSRHHIAPYDPAPLDPLVVTWPGLGGWEGGERDTADRHAGTTALRLVDDKPQGNVSARCTTPLPLASGALRLSFRHKADAGHRFIVSLGHQDAAGRWMSGRNNDLACTGTGAWTLHEQTITAFPPGAATATLTLWAARWADDGSTTGTVRYDEVRVQDAAGRDLIAGGGFEAPTPEQFAPRIDWSRWDAAMTRAMDVHHFSSFQVHIPGLGGGTFFERHEPELLGFRDGTPEYHAAFAAYGRAVESHLRDKGWLDRAFVYWFDEPDPKDYPFVMDGFRKLKAAAPGLRRMLTEQVEPGLVGGPDLWCPVSSEYRHGPTEERRRQGERFWWYVCCVPKAPFCTEFIDHAGTELRVWLWQTWQRGIDGILVWDTNYWTSDAAYPEQGRPQDPYADPMSWVSGYGARPGSREPWGNGDGRFIYPPEAAMTGAGPVLDGPVDSIRWEMLRDGIEDYEYLAMLRRLLATRGSALPAEERARCAALLEVPTDITAGITTFTRDPEPIERRRRALAAAIATLTAR